ncbi:unnamed protein product [Musa acuminata subsp. malaccensis]|uniref:(wild Malaysian banana) hypothetical protein n=1 Tax=Musa acuminata subsp. malaccensis TaxID=214687 RepID=A0A804JG79_MUSAM|nr:PREDICTED: uncharacterized protein LOC103987682 isoform X1 [Musa acuminata subsp. malaccensis]CAG1846252.1 unnamed protein product [Musa acuminata subsp. malaccensis]
MTRGAPRKVGISEEDVSLLLQRYNPTTILTLLQEVSEAAGVRIDWNALVKRTATGITSAREYQMLWRHLAYHHTLLETIEDGAEPLDDESDLELEIEAVPAVSGEALSEAAACVKVLISCGVPREQGLTSRTAIETPLAVNGFNNQALRVSSDKQQLSQSNYGTDITVPTLQKQPQSTGTSAEGLDGNGMAGPSIAPKKRRKPWTKEEDMELIAGVQKFGEGNWANILKGDFKHNRTASQLSQRWAIIRKRDTNLLASSGNKSMSSTRSEERLATQKAISLALDMPNSGRLSAILSGGTQSITPASSSALSAALSEALPVSSQPLNQLQQASTLATSQKITLNTSNKPRTTPKKSMVPVKPSSGPNSLIQAAAFAAGGRIATPSTAASLFKAAQSKNAVHIRPGGGARPSPINNVKTLAVTNSTGPQSTGVRISRPSVMAGPPAANPVSVSSGTRYGCQQVQGCSGRVGSNPLNTTSTNQQEIIESNSGEVSHEMTEQKGDIDISSIDVDELLAEEVKCVDEMELDGTMSHDDQMDLLSLDTNTNEDNDFNNTYDAQASVDEQMDPPDSMVAENIIMENNVVSSDVEAAESKALEVDDNDDQFLLEKGTASFNGEQNKISPVGNLNAQDHIVNQEQLISEEVMADNVRESCTNDQQHALPEDTASGSKIPIDDDSISTNDKEVE